MLVYSKDVTLKYSSNHLAGLYPGLTEMDIQNVLDNTLRAVGLEPFFDIVLFGE
jgi:hypothetical protein